MRDPIAVSTHLRQAEAGLVPSPLRLRKFLLMATVAAALAVPERAMAAGFLFFGNSEPDAAQTTGSIAPRKAQRRPKMRLPTVALKEMSKPHGPLVIAISINKQRVKVYDANGLFAEAPVSTGMSGHSTPTGVFSIIQKSKWHRSNIYSGAPMPYMQRITWSGIALHQGLLPGYPASHGCIRMPTEFAMRLWNWTRLGARVIVTPDEISPAEFSHAKLIAQMLPASPVATAPVADIRTVADAAPSSSSTDDRKADRLAIKLPSSPLDAQASAPRGGSAEPMRPAQDIRTADASDSIQIQQRSDASASSVASPAGDAIIAFDPAEDVPLAVMSDFAPKSAEKTSDDASQTTIEAKSESEPAAPPVAQAEKVAPDLSAEGKTADAPATGAKSQERLATTTPEPLGAIAAPAPIIAGSGAAKPASEQEQPQKPATVEKKRTGHVAVFISRKERKLFVRQGFEPLFDAPVEIAEVDRPLGTHLFTARADKDSASTLRWSVVSLPVTSRKAEADAAKRHAALKPVKGRKASPAVQESPPAPALPTAAEALDRVTIPEDALQRIAMAIQPGGSLIISDTGLGGETGLGTDFIVPLRQ